MARAFLKCHPSRDSCVTYVATHHTGAPGGVLVQDIGDTSLKT
jgi:hypothetical protein